jgi:hypothetical protein
MDQTANFEFDIRNALISYYTDEVLAKSQCPCTFEEFSVDNPPYQLSCCHQHVSRAALKQLPVYSSSKPSPTYQRCPLCRGKIRFAFLDSSYLHIINLTRDLQRPEPVILEGVKHRDDFLSSFRKHLVLRDQKVRDFPFYLQPKGGILHFLSYYAQE